MNLRAQNKLAKLKTIVPGFYGEASRPNYGGVFSLYKGSLALNLAIFICLNYLMPRT